MACLDHCWFIVNSTFGKNVNQKYIKKVLLKKIDLKTFFYKMVLIWSQPQYINIWSAGTSCHIISNLDYFVWSLKKLSNIFTKEKSNAYFC